MLGPILLTLVNAAQFVHTKSSCLGRGKEKKKSSCLLPCCCCCCLDFSQNKPSRHFLWNLWFLSVCRVGEHGSSSAHLERAPSSAFPLLFFSYRARAGSPLIFEVPRPKSNNGLVRITAEAFFPQRSQGAGWGAHTGFWPK